MRLSTHRSTAEEYALTPDIRCHLGQVIRYDTVSQLRWSVGLRTHSIAYIIDNLLSADWEGAEEGGVPGFYDEVDCSVRCSSLVSIYRLAHDIQDCYQWEFGNFKDSAKRSCS